MLKKYMYICIPNIMIYTKSVLLNEYNLFILCGEWKMEIQVEKPQYIPNKSFIVKVLSRIYRFLFRDICCVNRGPTHTNQYSKTIVEIIKNLRDLYIHTLNYKFKKEKLKR